MKDFYSQVKNLSNKKKNILIIVFSVFLVNVAMWMFPLHLELSMINAAMVIVYLMIGFLLHAVIEKKKIIVTMIVLLTNIMGFLFRVWLEWGET